MCVKIKAQFYMGTHNGVLLSHNFQEDAELSSFSFFSTFRVRNMWRRRKIVLRAISCFSHMIRYQGFFFFSRGEEKFSCLEIIKTSPYDVIICLSLCLNDDYRREGKGIRKFRRVRNFVKLSRGILEI